MTPDEVKGCAISLLGSSVTALGLVLQKYSHNRHVTGRYYFQKYWLLGFFLYCVGQVLNAVSMALTPQIIAAGLGSWTIACNVFFARLVLHEVVGSARACSVLGLMVVMLTMVLTAPSLPDDMAPTQSTASLQFSLVLHRLLSPGFLALTAAMVPSVLLLHLAARRQRQGHLGSTLQLPLSLVAWSWAGAAAGAYTTMLVKCIADFFDAELKSIDSVQDDRPCGFGCWFFWILLAVGASVFGVAEIHLSNLAFKSGDMVCAVPLYMSLEMILQLALGIVFFQEFQGFTSHIQMVAFLLSFALILYFLFRLAKASDGDIHKEDVSDSRSASRERVLQLAIQPLQPTARDVRLTLV